MNRLDLPIAIAVLAVLTSPAFLLAYDLHTKALTPIGEETRPSHPALELVKGGRCDFSLVFDVSNREAAKAAELLADCFRRCTGSAPAAGGRYELRFAAGGAPDSEAFAVRTDAHGITLLGNAQFAAMDFAERFLGVRWFYPGADGSIYPRVADLTVEPVAYSDAPYFRTRSNEYHFGMTMKNAKTFKKWCGYMGALDREEAASFAGRFWRFGSSIPVGGGHSPRPERLAAAHPDKLKTIFYTSPSGKFWYNPKGHVGNYFNVLDLAFADLLVDDWKAFYASGGADDRGGFKGVLNDTYVSFGCCDTLMPLSEVIGDPTVQRLGLISDDDIRRAPTAAMRGVYARFYKHVGERLKREMPDKRLYLLIYYNSQYASPDPRWKLPDNLELFVCDGRLPTKTRNPREMEKSVRLFREWYDATGRRPVAKAWVYAPRFDLVGRAIAPEFVGDIPKVLGRYLGRDCIFYGYDGTDDLWHHFYSCYALAKSEWNPDFDVDAALAEMFGLLFGREAGRLVTEFHSAVKSAYIAHTVPTEGATTSLPLPVVDDLERRLKASGAAIAPGTVEARRFRLLADYWPKAFETMRALAGYEPPVYEVKRLCGVSGEWDRAPSMPFVDTRTGAPAKFTATLKLLWDETGLHGRLRTAEPPAADESRGLFSNDSLEIFLSPGLGKETDYQLSFDCLGRTHFRKQRWLPIPQPPDASFDARGFVHSERRRADGWEASFMVPWSLFEEKPPRAYDSWNANFVRNKMAGQREYSGTSFTLGVNGNREMFGVLRFLGRGD